MFWCGLLLLALGAGCFPLPKSKPKAEVKSIQSKPEAAGSITPTVLQARAMRFADEYAMVVAQAAEDFGSAVGTFEARQVAARIKLGQATAAVVDAAGPNPVVNALDLVVLASVSRIVAEDYLVGERFGEAAMPLLEASRKLETNAWQLVKSVLKPEQDRELRDLIADWRQKNPHQRYVGAVRFREFAEAIDSLPMAGATKTSVFSLLFLDPMAGLDPTLRAVEETRYLAERALYYGQRMPILISWQTEYLALQLSDQPAARQMLTNADQLGSALQVFAQTAEQLPRLINQQREAAIEQIFAGLANERTNLLASLASEEKKTRELLAEARTTLNAAGEMAASVDGAVQSLESFVRYVSPPKTNNEPQLVKTNSRRFDVLDYGTAAGQIGGMAKDLNALLSGLNQSTPQVAQLGQQTAARAANLVMRGFWLGLLLIVILLAGAVLAGLTYRILATKLAGRERPAAPTNS